MSVVIPNGYIGFFHIFFQKQFSRRTFCVDKAKLITLCTVFQSIQCITNQLKFWINFWICSNPINVQNTFNLMKFNSNNIAWRSNGLDTLIAGQNKRTIHCSSERMPEYAFHMLFWCYPCYWGINFVISINKMRRNEERNDKKKPK